MAKTWTVTEAYNAIKANDKEGIADFGKRFPLATTALARAGVNEGLDVLFGAMPDRVTMRILEMQLKDGVSESADDEDEIVEEVAEEEVPEKPAKKEKAEKKAEKPAKAEKLEKKSKKAEKVEKEVKPEDDEEDAAEDATVDYKSMSAIELYKLCKSRGIKVEVKQKPSVYIKALEAADAGSDDSDDEDSDWDI